jgi:hypothetical protein
VDEKKKGKRREGKGRRHNVGYHHLIKLLLNCSGKKYYSYYLLDVILIIKQVSQAKKWQKSVKKRMKRF